MSSIYERPSVSIPPIKNDTRELSRIDLFNALESILWFWPEIFIHSAEQNQTPRENLTLARTVRLAGVLEGLAVFRSTPSLGVLMAQKLLRLEKMEEAESLAADAFSEFVNVFCGYLMDKIREKDKPSFRHFLPLELPKEKWPATPPDTGLVVGVQDHLLEIRLWITAQSSVETGKQP